MPKRRHSRGSERSCLLFVNFLACKIWAVRNAFRRRGYACNADITISAVQYKCCLDRLVIQGVANSDGVQFNLDNQRKMLDGYYLPEKIVESGHWGHDGYFFPTANSRRFVEGYHEVLIKLNDYKIALKEAVLDLERQRRRSS